MKKILFLALLLFIPLSSFALDAELTLMPQFDFHTGDEFNTGFSGKLAFNLFPFTVRGGDKIGFGAEGAISLVTAQTLDPTPIYSGDLSLTYLCRLHDRFALGASAFGGLWTFPAVPSKNSSPMSGILWGGKLFADFYLLPELRIGAFAGYSDYVYKPSSFAKKIDAGLCITYSFSRGIFSRAAVEVDECSTEPVFPVFYSYYNDNPFGFALFYNGEENSITDVKVYVYIPEYMQTPSLCAEYDSVKRYDYMEANLTAFFNETILESLASHKTEGKIIVTYSSLGKKITSEQLLDVTALNRNAMSWDDDRRAAAFVSSHDGAANKMSKLARSIVNKNPQNDPAENISFARGIFAVLKAYGISYVKDPTSPFSSSETASVDFLQFPCQTLLYSGGDCDDLSILNCAMFESIGISTAFITVPGHIFMAFDSGVLPENAKSVFKDGRYIIQDEKVWIPLEATVCQETFDIARNVGYNQWSAANRKGQAALYPIEEAWKTYRAVGVPESDADIELPPVDKVLRYLR